MRKKKGNLFVWDKKENQAKKKKRFEMWNLLTAAKNKTFDFVKKHQKKILIIGAAGIAVYTGYTYYKMAKSMLRSIKPNPAENVERRLSKEESEEQKMLPSLAIVFKKRVLFLKLSFFFGTK